MASVNNLPGESLITKFLNLSKMKQIIIGLMTVIAIIFFYDIF